VGAVIGDDRHCASALADPELATAPHAAYRNRGVNIGRFREMLARSPRSSSLLAAFRVAWTASASGEKLAEAGSTATHLRVCRSRWSTATLRLEQAPGRSRPRRLTALSSAGSNRTRTAGSQRLQRAERSNRCVNVCCEAYLSVRRTLVLMICLAAELQTRKTLLIVTSQGERA
jgi:hypothetical protein